MKIHLSAFFAFLVFFFQFIRAEAEEKILTIMSWNVENLFDTVHDEGRSDEEFTPNGAARWTEEKLKLKMKRLAQVINSVGTPCPDILVLVEVEHGRILKRFNEEYLKTCGYKNTKIHRDDPDPRGIRTAVLTRLDVVLDEEGRLPEPIKAYPGARYTLEIPVRVGDQVLHVFTNHWKSRRSDGGNGDNGESKRALSATALRKRFAELQEANPDADFIAMGDFNDEPENSSLKKVLGSTTRLQDIIDEVEGVQVWNPSSEIAFLPIFDGLDWNDRDTLDLYRKMRATFFFGKQQVYNQLDHFHLSRGLLDDLGFQFVRGSYQVVRHPMMTDSALRPIPLRQERGASDHFPITLKLKVDTE